MKQNNFIPEYQIKQQMLRFTQFLSARRLISHYAGSLGMRSRKNDFWMTTQSSHPLFLGESQLVRANLSGRVFGSGFVCETCQSHYMRLFGLEPEIHVACVLAPLYQNRLYESGEFPVLPEGPVNLSLPLCDPARKANGLLHGKLLVLWGKDLESLVRQVDEMDFRYCMPQPSTASKSHSKQELMAQVIAAVTAKLQNLGKE